ncbi:MAG TPA: hypothetical protein DDX39_11115 [Bacteroidales bacterium]|nr:MAG: hypothetical protein A2W98_13705 [Bacteroidetes bacterium GWF2_33_38]OFY73728.1 MAG: hypothetical protein A2265_11435 [Bacteroidetes bacterium RIFOXYA12_FULL_33_9]HBF89181.1 hypothetical protein [Bacteroidales bacterium]
MAITAIIILIVLGVLLLLLEFLVIPGVTIAGIGGIILVGGAVYLSYEKYGAAAGHLTLAGSLVFLIVILIIAFNSKTWNKLKLKSVIESKVTNVEEDQVKIGDIGNTISRLAPMGKVMINNEIFEAQSSGEYINQHTEIEVIALSQNKIIVKPLK